MVLPPLCSRKLGGALLGCMAMTTPLIKRLRNRRSGNDPERGFHLGVTKASRVKPRRRWHLPLGPCLPPEHLHSGGTVNSLPCVSEALLGVLAEMGFSQGSLAFGRAKKQYLMEG